MVQRTIRSVPTAKVATVVATLREIDGLTYIYKKDNEDGTWDITGSDQPLAVDEEETGTGSGGSSPAGGQPSAGDVMPTAHETFFFSKVAGIMQKLIDDFGFADFQAAGVLGNIGHECDGFQHLQEIHPIGGGAGGLGWAQWTASRRGKFVDWCDAHGFDTGSDEGNYGFLREELNTTHHSAVVKTKKTTTITEAVRVFEEEFEKAGVKHYERRERWAAVALSAFRAAHT